MLESSEAELEPVFIMDHVLGTLGLFILYFPVFSLLLVHFFQCDRPGPVVLQYVRPFKNYVKGRQCKKRNQRPLLDHSRL